MSAKNPPEAEPAGTERLPLDPAHFSANARDALRRADTFRRSRGRDRLHMEHLLVGLYDAADGQARKAFDGAKLHRGRLVNILASAGKLDRPSPEPYPPGDGETLPPVSRHVAEALVHARELAGASPLFTETLLRGALAVELCSAIAPFSTRTPEGRVLRQVLAKLTGVADPPPAAAAESAAQQPEAPPAPEAPSASPSAPQGAGPPRDLGAAAPVPAVGPTSSSFAALLSRYSFSAGAAAILASAGALAAAAKNGAALDSGLLLQAMAELGQRTGWASWAPDFLRQALARHEERYQGLLRHQRRLGIAMPEGSSASPEEAHGGYRGPASSDTVALLAAAAGAAATTTGGTEIAGRHLLAALLVAPPTDGEPGAAQRLLAEVGVDLGLLRESLFDWVRGFGDDDEGWRRLLLGTAGARQLAGFDADSPRGTNLLAIERDVGALATLIASRALAPPLAVGLFGEWGSGKTFFMRELRQTVARLSQEARDAPVMQRDHPFYKHVVQIELNAWHYVESNLWASLVEHIFANLHIPDERRPTVVTEMQEHWLRELGFRQAERGAAQQKEQEALSRLRDAEAEVDQAKREHDEKKEEHARLAAQAAGRRYLLGAAAAAARQALAALGITPASEQVVDVERALRQGHEQARRATALLLPLRHAEDRRQRVKALLVILLAAPLAGAIVYGLLRLLGDQRLGEIAGVLAGAATLLGRGAGWLRRQHAWTDELLAKLAGAQGAFDRELAERQAATSRRIAELEHELALAREDYGAAQRRAQEARRAEDAARAALAREASPAGLLARFVEDRAASTDYRKHLGVLALVRQDFERLSGLIEAENWRLEPAGEGDDRFGPAVERFASLAEEQAQADKRINRIVLYIDDLDRCPPTKVVEVLQAVHLLLAFPLFVVVVGVDARWITQSLETRYRHLRRRQGGEQREVHRLFGAAGPGDYLEKIFQIPLWLRPMDRPDVIRMLRGLTLEGGGATARPAAAGNGVAAASDALEAAEASAPPPGAPTAVPGAKRSGPDVAGPAGGEGDAGAGSPAGPARGDGTSGARASSADEPTPIALPDVESLQIHDFERRVMTDLAPFVGRSPRALKRYVNLYRLIKAGLSPAERKAFVQQHESRLADHAAVLFLLAVDTGLPGISREVFTALRQAAAAAGPTATRTEQGEPRPTGAAAPELAVGGLIAALAGNPRLEGTDEWRRLRTWLAERLQDRLLADGLGVLASWIPCVARYSFQARSDAAEAG